ncbi:MAG: dihydroneopterin triphosphate diphosphatase [Candidatus Sedimenticola sp. 20ELBAFRAG]
MTREYKRPESVLVLVYTAAGEVLMLRRTQPRQWWQSVTGSLEWNESPRQAAERELFEETGLYGAGRLVDRHHSERFPIIHPWRKRYGPGAHYNREHWFSLLLPGRRIIRLNDGEHTELRWLPVTQAARLATSWTNRDAILSLQHV